MLETISDGLSLSILIFIPVVIAWQAISVLLNKRKTKKREEVGKYYREW